MYLFSNKLQSTRNFRKEFGMLLLGTIRRVKVNKGILKNIDTWLLHLEEGPYAEISYGDQVKIATANVEAIVSNSIDKLGDIEKRKL